MKLATYFISYGRSDSMKTEILFRIATARSAGCDLIRLDISGTEDDRDQIILRSKKILKAARTAGTVNSFAYASDFEKNTTEGMYFLNVYPEIAEYVAKPEYSYIYIKI